MVDIVDVRAVEVVRRARFDLYVRSARAEREAHVRHGPERALQNQVASLIRLIQLVADKRPLALLDELEIAVDLHRRVRGLHALRDGDVKLALRGVAQRPVEVFQLHRLKVRRVRGRERDAVVAVGGGIGERIRAHLVGVLPGLVVH